MSCVLVDLSDSADDCADDEPIAASYSQEEQEGTRGYVVISIRYNYVMSFYGVYSSQSPL